MLLEKARCNLVSLGTAVIHCTMRCLLGRRWQPVLELATSGRYHRGWYSLRLDLVEDIEGVLQWDPPHAAEARLRRELPQLSFRQSHGAKPLAMAGERGGHAIEHAAAIEQ